MGTGLGWGTHRAVHWESSTCRGPGAGTGLRGNCLPASGCWDCGLEGVCLLGSGGLASISQVTLQHAHSCGGSCRWETQPRGAPTTEGTPKGHFPSQKLGGSWHVPFPDWGEGEGHRGTRETSALGSIVPESRLECGKRRTGQQQNSPCSPARDPHPPGHPPQQQGLLSKGTQGLGRVEM